MIFIPKNGEKFWYIDMFGYILSSNNDNDKMHRIKSGNCYRTKEDAVRARDRQYAKRELEVFLNEEYPTGSFVMYRTLNSLFNTMTIGIKIKDSMYAKCLEKLGEAKLRLILEVE